MFFELQSVYRKTTGINKVMSKTNWCERCEVEFAVVKVRSPTVTEWLVLR